VKPLVLTPGESAGICAEITAKAWATLQHEHISLVLIGDSDDISNRVQHAGLSLPLRPVDDIGDSIAGTLSILHRPLAAKSVPGKLNVRNAPATIAAIEEAVSLCESGRAAGIVTNPIQKETLYDAGFSYQGHTDFLGALARKHGHDAKDVMMLVAQDLRAIPLTVHIPLSEVIGAITEAEIAAQTRVVVEGLRTYFNVKTPRIAVTGLNPHAGENGKLGNEENTIIKPAIAQLKKEGHDVFGPLPGDTAFHAEARQRYDAIICMYHDQALIPAKTIDFHGGVNVTLGLPFIRTSPDHGTALDLAGTGRANPTSLIAAIRLARQMAHNAGLQ
jgi:4-hydroxythreonine-4-phosphate dehydrogenase